MSAPHEGDESVARVASSVARVMKEEGLPYTTETAFELAEDLWSHAKQGELGVLLPEQSFVDTFPAAVLVEFLRAVAREMGE